MPRLWTWTSSTMLRFPHRPLKPSSSSQSSPRRPRLQSGDASPRRSRINSRDIPRSSAYEAFEVSRMDLAAQSVWFLFIVYATVIGIVHVLAMLAVDNVSTAPTLTNVGHGILSLAYIHWLKGSLYDAQGVLSGLTVWEQLEAASAVHLQSVLLVVPTLLTYLACHCCDYDPLLSSINIVVWLVLMLAKLPQMIGVRLFGINRTPGIDDEGKDL